MTYLVQGTPMTPEKISPSEAVFAFAAWLASRRSPVTLSRHHDAAPAANLAAQWCQINELPEPRDGIYPANIRQPELSEA